jgi:hypothetical protein
MQIRFAENKARMKTQPLELNGRAIRPRWKAFKISRVE